MAFLPVAAVHGSSGTVDLGTVTNESTAAGFATATSFVNVTAGSDAAYNDCGTGSPGLPTCNANFFAIKFNTVTFSGSQFKLYLSTNGFSQINFTTGQTQDLQYGPTFDVSALSTAYALIGTTGYHEGTDGATNQLIVGPIPTQISNAYKFIKIFDGSSTSVAASLKKISILPGISVKPTSGAAGAAIVVTGGGFPKNTVIDILYQFTTYQWTTNAAILSSIANLTTGISTGSGYFSKTTAAPDTKESVNTLLGLHNDIPIALFAKLEKAPHTLYATTTFHETPRFITEVKSLDNAGTCVGSTGPSATGSANCGGAAFSSTRFYGNDTGSTGAIVLNGVTGTLVAYPSLNAKVKGSIIIAGNDTFVNAPVTFWIGSTQVGSATSGADGTFNGTATIPVLPSGAVSVLIKSNSVIYNFGVTIVPTLILTPSSGPVGTTVTVSAYGFPSNKHVSLWWYRYQFSGTNEYYLVNGTVDTSGSYNVTVTFVVPHSYGGPHHVDATTDKWGSPVPRGTITGGPGYVTFADFTVTATLTVTPTSVDSNSKTWIVASGTGYYPYWVYVNIDNALFSDCNTETTNKGDFNITFTAAGFRPGWHQVETWACSGTPDVQNGQPNGYAFFNVTTKGDYISGQISTFTATINGLKTSMNQLSTQIGTLTTSVSSIASNVNTILANTNGLSNTLSSLGSKIDALNTALGTTGSSVNSISGKLDTISSKIDTISSSLSSTGNIGQAISGMQTQVKSTQDAVSSASTYVLVVAVLAAITLVLELAILVRKLH